MALRKLLTIRPEALPTTTDASTWTTLASFTVNNNCAISIEWWVLGRATATGNIASANGNHRAKRVAAVLSPVGNILFLLTFSTGSSGDLTSCTARISISGDVILLQIKGVAATNIEWDGGMIIKQN